LNLIKRNKQLHIVYDDNFFNLSLIKSKRIVMFENAASGYMMLLGQIADALSTVFVGFESDKTEKGFFNYGRRKSWHLVGIDLKLFQFCKLYIIVSLLKILRSY
jgi:hypothetical protein